MSTAFLASRRVAALLLLLVGACGSGGSQRDLFVSVQGSDETGDGSIELPWQTIQHAIDEAAPFDRIRVSAGTYFGPLAIHRPVTIVGESTDLVVVRNLGVIDFVVRITAGAVRLEKMTIDCLDASTLGVHAIDALPILREVHVEAPSGYGIVFRNCSGFEITDCFVGSVRSVFSDVGIDLNADVGRRTDGTILRLTAGDFIDHIVNIGLHCHVTIEDSELRGSTIYYADGIRIQGPSTVTVRGTTIIRPPTAEVPGTTDLEHNLPYAGVEVAMSSDRRALVTLDHCVIRGFDVGVGINMTGNQLLVRDCRMEQNVSAAADTFFSGHGSLDHPTIDFGGGALGSPGRNVFGDAETWGFFHRGPYDVSARLCDWSVPSALIPERIRDRADDPTLGSVSH